MKKISAGVLLLVLTLTAGVIYRKKNRPLEVPFAPVKRETLISTLPSNGKVEPIEWQPVRVDTAGLIDKLRVEEGRPVIKGGVMVQMSRPGLDAELAAAQARVAQARAESATAERGGRASDIAEIESGLAKAKTDRDTAQREVETLQRLANKQAAPKADVEAARNRVRQAELETQALQRRRAALSGAADKAVAEARLRDAEAAVALVRARMAETAVSAPVSGIVYGLAVRQGAYVNPGDLIANIGRLDTLRVRVYVDEPELGRVAEGQPVTITWDALPGKTWSGKVERKPATITALGSRQVGEVWCSIVNPGRELVPGTNVNAEIRTNVAENALTVPKEALRREGNEAGVFVRRDDKIEWRAVKTGVTSITRAQVLGGVNEGDEVALPVERVLRPGMRVQATYP